MSAALLSVIAPTAGRAAPAQGAKGAARASSESLDFAAALSEAAALSDGASANAMAAGPRKPGTRAEPVEATASGEDRASTTTVDISAQGAVVVLEAVVPPTSLTSVVLAAQPSADGGDAPEAEATGAAPAPASAPQSTAPSGFVAMPAEPAMDAEPDRSASPARAGARSLDTLSQGEAAGERGAAQPSAPVDPVEPGATSPVSNVDDPEVGSAASPAASDRARDVANARSAVVTTPRPAKSATYTDPAVSSAVGEAEIAPVMDEAVAERSPIAPAPTPVETTRVRDVIDRAVVRAPATSAVSPEASSAKGEARSENTPSAGSMPTAAAVADPVSTKVEFEAATALPQAVAAEDPTATSALAPTVANSVGLAETTETPGLSTLSRAAVETTAQIAAQIVRKLEGRSTRFEMALTPEDLGRVDVSLDIDADGALHATLAFDNPVAATELRGRADELRRQLTEAGFTVGDDALSFSERDPSAGQGGAFDRDADHRDGRSSGSASRLAAGTDPSLKAPAWIPLSLTSSGVDLKV